MKKRSLGQKFLYLLLILAFSTSSGYGCFGLLNKTEAAGIDNITVTLANETISTASQVDVAWTPATALTNGDIISIYLGENTTGEEWVTTGVLASDLGCANTGGTFSGTSVNAATASLPAYVVIGVTAAGTGGSPITCSIGNVNDPTNPGVADGYEVAAVTNDDAGAGIAYVGNNNDVTVTAAVLPLLNLTISDNTMNLGTVLTTNVGTDNHTISVGTNATDGATVQIDADAALNNASDSWADVAENSTVTAGTEGYGIAFTAGAGWTESGDFADDDTPIPLTASSLMTSAGAIDDSITSTVTYRAAVSATTPTGVYNQIVTYTATANF
jgi:hypothetical protein